LSLPCYMKTILNERSLKSLDLFGIVLVPLLMLGSMGNGTKF
jgi:hypothetical protein